MGQKFVGIAYPIRRGQTGMFSQTVNIREQTKYNFENLIRTKKGERLAHPTLGCDVWKTVLFEQITQETLEKARLAVIQAVNTWLPYLELTDFRVLKSENESTVTLRCTYRFRNNPGVQDTVEISNISSKLQSTTTILSRTEAPTGVITKIAEGGRVIRGFNKLARDTV